MGFGFKQPLVGEKRCVTTLITAAKETMGKKQPEKIRASTGFEPMTSANTGAMLYQLSYEATHWL